MKMNKEVVMVKLSDIIPNRFQPRLTFDEEALNELASSIKEHGIIQPLIMLAMYVLITFLVTDTSFLGSDLIQMTIKVIIYVIST